MRPRGFDSFPQLIRRLLRSTGWLFLALGAMDPFYWLGRAHPRAVAPVEWLFSGEAVALFFAAAVVPLLWWMANMAVTIRKGSFPWRYGKAQSLRIWAALLCPILPALLWHLTHPVMERLHRLHQEDTLEAGILIVCGLVLLLGARRLTRDFVFAFPDAR